MRGGALQRSDRNCALNLRFSAGPYSAPIQRCVILNEVKDPNAARLATALSLRVHFRLYELVTTMLTSAVRFNYNPARANQSPDTSCPPPSAAHLTPRIPSSWHRPSSLKNLRRLIANPRLEFHLTPIRISELKFPNRKFSAILPRTRGLLESPASSLQKPWPPWRLIETQGLENTINPINPATSNFLIETKRGFCVRRGGTGFSQRTQPCPLLASAPSVKQYE